MGLAKFLRKAASKPINKLGGDVTIKRFTNGIYDASSGTFFKNESSVTIKGVLSNVSRNQVNDLIESQDKILTISAADLTFVPTTKDTVIIDSVKFKIIQTRTNEQNNTPISFDLILR
tara:strand:+ start:148 stop:501 length:354 start_codon:yes stop_codon:yes gene_type:complete